MKSWSEIAETRIADARAQASPEERIAALELALRTCAAILDSKDRREAGGAGERK